MPKPAKAVQKYRELYLAASAASVGLELALAVVIGWALGYWLDGKFGTTPWLTALFFAAGIGAGAKAVLRVARQAKRANEEEEAGSAERKPAPLNRHYS